MLLVPCLLAEQGSKVQNVSQHHLRGKVGQVTLQLFAFPLMSLCPATPLGYSVLEREEKLSAEPWEQITPFSQFTLAQI